MSAVLPNSASGVNADEYPHLVTQHPNYARGARGPTETFTHEPVGPGGQHLISPEGCEAFSERNESTRPHLAPTTDGPTLRSARATRSLITRRATTAAPDTVASCLHRLCYGAEDKNTDGQQVDSLDWTEATTMFTNKEIGSRPK